MKTHGFNLITDAGDLDDLPLDALFESGCDDGSPASRCGVAFVTFHRDAESIDQAIASAIRDVEAGLAAGGAPYRVVRVDSHGSSVAEGDLRAIERANAGLSAARAATAGASGVDRGT